MGAKAEPKSKLFFACVRPCTVQWVRSTLEFCEAGPEIAVNQAPIFLPVCAVETTRDLTIGPHFDAASPNANDSEEIMKEVVLAS